VIIERASKILGDLQVDFEVEKAGKSKPSYFECLSIVLAQEIMRYR
jgi:hypothetical protein